MDNQAIKDRQQFRELLKKYMELQLSISRAESIRDGIEQSLKKKHLERAELDKKLQKLI
jgi:hypothetical protein